MAVEIVHVDSYTALSNYNFHGLSPGTDSIPCTENPTNNQDWVFASKKYQLSALWLLVISLDCNFSNVCDYLAVMN